MLVELKMYLQQMDVCTAYLKSPLSPLKHPTIFDDDECKDRVLRLNKAIYGLKQAWREWNATLDEALREIGFVPIRNIVPKRSGQVKSKIASRFECVDKGQLNMFLGTQIEYEGELGRITMNQALYIKDILQRQGLEQCRPNQHP